LIFDSDKKLDTEFQCFVYKKKGVPGRSAAQKETGHILTSMPMPGVVSSSELFVSGDVYVNDDHALMWMCA